MFLYGLEFVDALEVALFLSQHPFLVPWSSFDDLMLSGLQNATVHGAEVVAEVTRGEE